MRQIITTVLLYVALGSPAQGYDYRNGVEAPHPNSKYWKVTGQRPPLVSGSSKESSLRLLQQENALLRKQIRLLQQQVAVLRARLQSSGR